jgi:CHASE1-domain containing sensor protein
VPIRAIALWSGVGLGALLLVALIVAMSRRSRRAA